MQQKYFIPTYEECLEMVSNRGNLVFYETKFFIDGYDISCFNYRLADYMDFLEPIEGKHYNARELRGLTYVRQDDGTYSHFLMLNKFWNIDQVTETQCSILTKKIKSVYNKMDGSLLSFIKLPNDKILAKTKMGFSNSQTDDVDILVSENKLILNFINECFEKDLVTMWEYTSFKNRIVLEYKNSSLTLLKVRNNKTGEYIDIEQFRNMGFDVVESIKFTDLKTLMDTVYQSSDIEGVVITFDDDMMVKFKSKWYCDLHHLIDNINREDLIIEMILNENVDDAIVQLDQNSDIERIKWIKDIELKIRNYMILKVKDVEEMISKYDGSMKDFALKYLKTENFGLAASVISGKIDVYSAVKNYVLKETSRLGKARDFLEKIK